MTFKPWNTDIHFLMRNLRVVVSETSHYCTPLSIVKFEIIKYCSKYVIKYVIKEFYCSIVANKIILNVKNTLQKISFNAHSKKSEK